MENTKNIIDIGTLMNDEDKNNSINDECVDFFNEKPMDGELISKLRPGMIVRVRLLDIKTKAFILSIDRKEGTFCGTFVSDTPVKNGIYIETSSTNVEYDGENTTRKDIIRGMYIDLTRITMFGLMDVYGYNSPKVIAYTTYLEVLNKIIESFEYEKVVEEYEKNANDMTYEKMKDQAKAKGINIQQAKDPKTILIQNMKKQIEKLSADLATAKKYKDASKEEIGKAKQDYRSLKATFDELKKENEALKKQVSTVTEEKDGLTGKYHELLEKYATAEKDPKLQEENDNLKLLLDEKESKYAELQKKFDEMTESQVINEKSAKAYSTTVENLRKELSTAETSIRQLTEKLADSKRELTNCKSELTKRDKTIEKLKSDPLKTVDKSTENSLRDEIKRLTQELNIARKSSVNGPREYTLTPYMEFGTDTECITVPTVIGHKYKKMMSSVSEDLRPALFAQIMNFFEESVKNGDITVNVMTKLTL